MKAKYETREEWLNAAIDLLRPEFQKRAGIKLPKNLRISCGFTSAGRRGKRIGECWSASSTTDEVHEMYISPVLDEPVRVLGVTVHECTHAGVGLEHGHKAPFRKAAKAMLLEGKMKATTEGEPFKKEFAGILAKLGEYPHGKLRTGTSSGPKKQATRLLKVHCPSCGYTTRITQKWIEVGVPLCPNEDCEQHGSEMEVG
jgi:hypothetical protein